MAMEEQEEEKVSENSRQMFPRPHDRGHPNLRLKRTMPSAVNSKTGS